MKSVIELFLAHSLLIALSFECQKERLHGKEFDKYPLIVQLFCLRPGFLAYTAIVFSYFLVCVHKLFLEACNLAIRGRKRKARSTIPKLGSK